MAKAKVVHSDDACTIIFNGDKQNPEPSTGIIKFPGGHIEVARTSDGQYWVHTTIDGGHVTHSRIDYDYDYSMKTGGAIPPIPDDEFVKKIAVKIGNVNESISED